MDQKYNEHIRLELVADREGFKFNFRLGGMIVKSSYDKDMSLINNFIKDFEKSYPESNCQDLVNPKYLIPEDVLLSKFLNPIKKELLVTTAQTSGSLSSYGYEYLIPFVFSIK